MQTNECFMCGNNDFVVNDGVFICTECGIQSQTIREEHIDINHGFHIGTHNENVDGDHKTVVGSQLEKSKKLLSWECFNLILLGLTNEMIELGAKPNLKIVVLQLWVLYLQQIEAAFTSKTFKKLPKLNTTLNNIDCEILYGVENAQRKILHAKTGIKFKLGNDSIKRHINKRKLLPNSSNLYSVKTESQKRKLVYNKLRRLDHSLKNKDSNNDSAGFSNDINLLKRNKKSSKIKIKLTKTLKSSLLSMPSKNNHLTPEEYSVLLETGKRNWYNLKHREAKNNITIKTLVAILQLALMINDDDIYLSDILRWTHEGHLHINRANLFLPENVLHSICLSAMVNYSSRIQLNLELSMLLKCLKTNELPKIDYKKMILRFCEELQLPIDFTHFVCKLVLLSPPNVQFVKKLPDIEVKIMAYILFAAKFVFCLDNNAENLSSDFAEKVNQSNKSEKQLFCWNDYVNYIECRNSVTSNYNYLLHKNIYGNNVRNTELFINNWNTMKSTLPIKNNLSKNFRDNTEFLLKSLNSDKEKRNYREIPAFTKPLSSTLNWIFEYYPTLLTAEVKQILKHDFIQTDILYLTDKKKINDLADECGIPIEINCNQPLHYVEKEKNNTMLTSCPLNTKTKVYLTNRLTTINKNILTGTCGISHEEEKPNTVFLGMGKNYWFIHFPYYFLKRSDSTTINTVLKNQLPYSFLWLMTQCCRLLNCSLSEVYWELISVEKMFLSFQHTKEKSKETELEDSFSNISL